MKEKQDFIEKVIKNEEERFHETLHEGLTILFDVIKKQKEKGNRQIPGEDVFRLYDTYGFPVELTEEYAEEEEMTIDYNGFESEMEKQRGSCSNSSTRCRFDASTKRCFKRHSS